MAFPALSPPGCVTRSWNWADQPLPALKNRTPRECARTATGRAEVDLLLKDMEHRERRVPGMPFDFSAIRRELGIGPG